MDSQFELALSIALAVDAFVVATSLALSSGLTGKLKRSIFVATVTGFSCVMLLMGFMLGRLTTLSVLPLSESVFGITLLFLGFLMLRDNRDDCATSQVLTVPGMFAMAFLVNVDAALCGLTIDATWPELARFAVTLGVATAVATTAGLYLAATIQKTVEETATRFGGWLLVLLGGVKLIP